MARDYAAEYRRRVAGLRPGSEAYARARGHRGPADFERALQSRTTAHVQVRGHSRDRGPKDPAVVIATVTDTRGRKRTFILQRGQQTPEEEAEQDRDRVRWEDIADEHGVDFDWSVSP